MKNTCGTPVVGVDFFGREKELAYVWQLLLNNNNLVFPSPRRIGKTSFALQLLEKAKSEGWEVVSINLEKNKSEIAFIEDLITTLKKLSTWEQLKDRTTGLLNTLKQFKPSFEHEGYKVSIEWQTQKEDIYKELAALLNHEQKTLIFFDELTVLLANIMKQENGLDETASFLHWLRDLRLKSGSQIRWVFCSSVGIENYLHAHNISDTMNDTKDYFLRSFDTQTSQEMLQKLSDSPENDLVLSPEMQKAIIEKLVFCIPFFLQLMFEKINYLHRIEEMPLDETIVSTAYNALIEEKHFNTWIERIEKQYGELSEPAFVLLRHICQESAGSKRENLVAVLSKNTESEKAEKQVSQLLYMLKNDGYLIEEDALYVFRSPLLRDFWFNRHVK